jgi:hypothetical protein
LAESILWKWQKSVWCNWVDSYLDLLFGLVSLFFRSIFVPVPCWSLWLVV